MNRFRAGSPYDEEWRECAERDRDWKAEQAFESDRDEGLAMRLKPLSSSYRQLTQTQRYCCDGLCQQTRYCPATDNDDSAPTSELKPALLLSSGAVEGPAIRQTFGTRLMRRIRNLF